MSGIPEHTDHYTMRDWQKVIREWAVRKEWRGEKAETQRTTGDDMALIHSEVSEALESFRVNTDPLAFWFTYTVEVNGVKFKNLTAKQLGALGYSYDDIMELEGKPEGIGPELADTVIRILDYCAEVGLDMNTEVRRKMMHNDGREVRHGGAHL